MDVDLHRAEPTVGTRGRIIPPHPLLATLHDAANGVFPDVDGVVEVLPTDEPGTGAIVEFTGHTIVLTERRPDDEVVAGVDAFAGATQPRFVVGVAGEGASIGSHDLVLVRRGGSTSDRLPMTDQHDAHPRVRRARHHRHDVEVLGDERGLVTIGSGLAGRTELSVEVVGEHGAGAGRAMICAALATVSPETRVFAQVAPGNAASVRAFLACGFVPIGSEILFEVAPGSAGPAPWSR